MKNKLKKMVLPLSVVGMLAIGSTSVFASEVDKSDNSNNIIQPFLTKYDLEVSINNLDDAQGDAFTPSYANGKIWYNNKTDKSTKVNILHNNTSVLTLTVAPNSSSYTLYTFQPGDTYTYSVTAVDGSVVPKGKLVIKTAQSSSELSE